MKSKTVYKKHVAICQDCAATGTARNAKSWAHAHAVKYGHIVAVCIEAEVIPPADAIKGMPLPKPGSEEYSKLATAHYDLMVDKAYEFRTGKYDGKTTREIMDLVGAPYHEITEKYFIRHLRGFDMKRSHKFPRVWSRK